MARPKAQDKEVKAKKGGVTKKDSDAPKRPQSAFFLWLGENRPRIRTANPDAKVSDIAKIAGKEWNELSDKSKWEAEALKLKEAYQQQMEEYKKTKAK